MPYFSRKIFCLAHVRKQNNCLNCDAIVAGRYCQHCGQENTDPKESFGHLLLHFVADIFHYDSKFLKTIKSLFFRPGFLSKEYMAGRRQSYLHPIKMFVFTTAAFFLIYFLLHRPNDDAKLAQMEALGLNTTERLIIDSAARTTDQHFREQSSTALNIISGLKKTHAGRPADIIVEDLPGSYAQYVDEQNRLPEHKKDNWLIRKFKEKRYRKKQQGEIKHYYTNESLRQHLLKSTPQILFFTIPVIALFLKLMYSRSKHKYVYTNHLIFLIHTVVALYLILIFYYLFQFLNGLYSVKLFEWTSDLFGVIAFCYPAVAMYNFYRQSLMKTVAKYLLLFTFSIVNLIVFIVLYALILYFIY